VSVLIVGSVVWTNPARTGVGFALLAAGVPAYLYWSRRRENFDDTDARSAEETPRG
jgi:hypothetical protein